MPASPAIRPLLLALLAVALCAPVAQAEDYPARPVRLIVGFAAGSSADITARLLADKMGKSLGQQFIVETKPGAGSSLAAEFVARAPKDGYTLLLGSSANLTNAAINPNPNLDMLRDFAPVAPATTAALILVAHPSAGVKTVADLIALAKAKPGDVLYASTGVGTVPHLSGELFGARTGTKLTHVPYQGSPQAVTDLLAGRTTIMFSPAAAVLPHVESGKLVALAATTAQRTSAAPNLPTMIEAGVADFDTAIWFGLMAPAGTPRPIVDKLAAAANEALKSDESLAALRAQGFDTLSGSPDDFRRSMERETVRWREAAKAAGLTK